MKHQSTRAFWILQGVFLLSTGIAIGAIVCAGIFTAPSIFGAKNLGVDISKFESGIIMTSIFLKLNNLLIITLVLSIFYTIYGGIRIFNKTQTTIQGILLSINAICIIVFIYFSEKILQIQKLGSKATSTESFINMHHQSELVFKILLFSLIINFTATLFFMEQKNDTSKI